MGNGFINGGWIMLPLFICSIISITIIIERWLFFRKFGKTEMLKEAMHLAEQGNMAGALAEIQHSTLPMAKIIRTGLTQTKQKAVKAMEAAAMAEIGAMRRGLSALDTIITLSPLLGLLGTILGMIHSFQIMADTGLGQPHAVTGGVGEALIATAAGITVAVATLIPYNYFLARIEYETGSIEQYATKVELLMIDSGLREETK